MACERRSEEGDSRAEEWHTLQDCRFFSRKLQNFQIELHLSCLLCHQVCPRTRIPMHGRLQFEFRLQTEELVLQKLAFRAFHVVKVSQIRLFAEDSLFSRCMPPFRPAYLHGCEIRNLSTEWEPSFSACVSLSGINKNCISISFFALSLVQKPRCCAFVAPYWCQCIHPV